MRKSAGFTLIELVIVIVILGILGAVAAPRFINMQGDAYKANVTALSGSIQSAMTLANTKAILDGYDREPTASRDVNGKEVGFVHGFPAASKDGIIEMLQDKESFTGEASTYILTPEDADGKGTLTITPRARSEKECKVEYKAAEGKNTPATVVAITTGC